MSFPVYLSQFVGRNTELGEIKLLLQEKSIRLLTLTGPGGSGKTRLAYETITGLADTFENGQVWVELAGLSDVGQVPQAVAASLEVIPAPGQTLLEALTFFLQNRELLVVLDNCEHLRDACTQLIEEVLRACPALRFLATSRISLQVEGEYLWPVPGLSYPAGLVASADAPVVNALEQFDAPRLFTARAKQVRPSFEIDDENASALIRICQVLEGMPLAIELAASWINVLGVDQMIARLENQLAFPTKKMGDGDLRHQSMLETIRWSYDLLSEAEKTLFHRLGAFSGGFSLEAAEKVCGGMPLAEDRILGLMGRLIDHSLVSRERTQGGGTRYRQLESIRQFAREQMQESGEESNMRERHLAFFSSLIREAAAHLLGPHQKIWTETLDADYENLLAALSLVFQYAAEYGDGHALDLAAETANRLYWLWDYTSRYETGQAWYQKIMELPGLDRFSPAYADLARNHATLTWLLGDYPAAQTGFKKSLEAALSLEYSYGIGHAKMLLSIMSLHQGKLEGVVEALLECEERFQALGKERELGIAQANLGGAYLAIGNLDAARRYAELVVHNARARQDLWGLGLALSGLGDVLFKQGEAEDAFKVMDEAQEMLGQSNQRWLLAELLWRLADMRQKQGEFELAEELFERCFDTAQETGALQWQLETLISLGFVSMSREEYQQAAGYFMEALQQTPGEEYILNQLDIMVGLAQLAAFRQQWEAAVTLWAAYKALKKVYGLSVLREEGGTLALLQPHMDSPEASQWVRAGQGMSLADAAGLVQEIAAGFKMQVSAVPAKQELRLLALGPTEVYLQGRQLVPADWTFAKPKELLFYLASSPPKTKEQIGLVFWPEASPGQLRLRLRAALYHLRRALGRREWILYESGYYRFNHDLDYWYDLEAFETGLEEGENYVENSPQQAVGKLEAVVELYRGDFLAGITNDDWGVLYREELKRKYLAALASLGDLYVEQGAPERAVDVYRLLLETDNLREETHRALMRTYAFQGERALALRHYDRLVELLQDELGVEPSPETTALYQDILGEPS